MQADLGIDEVDAASYQGLVLPGGRAPEYLRNRPAAVAIVRHFLDAGKPIAANCHGPLLVLAAGGVQGRTMTCYPELEPDLRAAGVTFVNREVVVDGPLITVRGWPDNGHWMKEFVRLVKDDQEVSSLGGRSGGWFLPPAVTPEQLAQASGRTTFDSWSSARAWF